MSTAIVIGASGGIGGALLTALGASGGYGAVLGLSRTPPADHGAVRGGFLDITDEASIAAAAGRIAAPVDLLLVATGMLHEDGRKPERALREIDGAALARSFAINATGPALVLKHFAPLLARDRRAVIGVLSARVGSISDNRSGGWYGYRASKAALNMIVRSAAIEIARGRPQAICVALHPGTVDTGLSRPFQARVPAEKLFSPDLAAARLLRVIAGLRPEDTGGLFAWDGARIAP